MKIHSMNCCVKISRIYILRRRKHGAEQCVLSFVLGRGPVKSVFTFVCIGRKKLWKDKQRRLVMMYGCGNWVDGHREG